MLRAGRFVEFAGPTLYFFLKHCTVVLKTLDGSDDLLSFGILGQHSRICPTCREVARIAYKHDHGTQVDMDRRNSFIWNLWKAFGYIDIEASKRAEKVNDLNYRIRFPAHIANQTFNQAYGSLATYFGK